VTTLEVGRKLVELCNQGKQKEAMETLYSQDIASIEASAMPNLPAEMYGIKAIREKAAWWDANHEIHAASAEGPWPKGDQFVVRFTYDVTNKPSNQRFKMDEAALYTVHNGKIVREEFFYSMG
jgi:hypothetical protein